MPYNAAIATMPISTVREETGGKNSMEVKGEGIHLRYGMIFAR